MTWDDLAALQRSVEGILLDTLGVGHSDLAREVAVALAARVGAARNPSEVCRESAHELKEQLAEALATRLHEAVRRATVKRVTG